MRILVVVHTTIKFDRCTKNHGRMVFEKSSEVEVRLNRFEHLNIFRKTMPTTRSKRKAGVLTDENVKQKGKYDESAPASAEKKCPWTVKKSKPSSANLYGLHPDSTVKEVAIAVMNILVEVCAFVHCMICVCMYVLNK